MSPILEDASRQDQPTGGGEDSNQSRDRSPPSELSKDAIFDLLRSSRRREVLHYLNEQATETNIGTLAEHVAAVENDIDVNELTSTQRKRVYISLYQSHLPKMADHGVIEYDDRGTVRLLEPAELLFPYLCAVPGREEPRRVRSTGLPSDLLSGLRRLLGH